MNVFVLGTGRCGSMTFIQACRHITNFTTGHETRRNMYGAARFNYPDSHIEADNRLSWFLGLLPQYLEHRDVLYVHLKRDPEAVAKSCERRWRRGIIEAFAHKIITSQPVLRQNASPMRKGLSRFLRRRLDWPNQDRLEICRFYVETVNANIEEFLRAQNSMTIWVEEAKQTFPHFLDRIGAEGDRVTILSEWSTRYNASL